MGLNCRSRILDGEPEGPALLVPLVLPPLQEHQLLGELDVILERSGCDAELEVAGITLMPRL